MACAHLRHVYEAERTAGPAPLWQSEADPPRTALSRSHSHPSAASCVEDSTETLAGRGLHATGRHAQRVPHARHLRWQIGYSKTFETG